MNRPGRILIVDDDPMWCEQLVETLQKSGFLAEAVSTVSEALNALNLALFHVLVLDIRMDKNDESNKEGITLLRELDERGLSEPIKVIMLSAFGTIERMRTAFREYEVADFLLKDNNFTREVLLESILGVYSKRMGINLALDVNWQSRNKSELAVLNLEISGMHVKRRTPLQNLMAVELDDLICRLFHDAESVVVQMLPSGRSGTGVLRIQPYYSARGVGNEVIVKFGECEKIEHEYKNFKQYVQPFIGGGRSTTVLDVRRTQHLGGIIYSLLGTSNDKLVDFGTFYRRSDLFQIEHALHRLFNVTCNSWYVNREPLHPFNLIENYQRMSIYPRKKLEQTLSKQIKYMQGKHKFFFNSLNHRERAFTNPLVAMDRLSIVRPAYTCATHGDFNQYNLLVDDAGNTWLIDFQDTGKSHILRDVAMLDAVVRFQLLLAEEATLEERLQMEEALFSIKLFSQVHLLAQRFQTSNLELAKAYASVVQLRKLAFQLVEHNLVDDLSEYYIALLYCALNTLGFSSLQQVQREHALLSASLLVDKLGLDNK
jgi:DNA-binding response OmpR family regulator